MMMINFSGTVEIIRIGDNNSGDIARTDTSRTGRHLH